MKHIKEILNELLEKITKKENMIKPEIGKKYQWKHAPDRYSLVLGFYKDQVIEVWDCDIQENILEGARLTPLSGFILSTNIKEIMEK